MGYVKKGSRAWNLRRLKQAVAELETEVPSLAATAKIDGSVPARWVNDWPQDLAKHGIEAPRPRSRSKKAKGRGR